MVLSDGGELDDRDDEVKDESCWDKSAIWGPTRGEGILELFLCHFTPYVRKHRPIISLNE